MADRYTLDAVWGDWYFTTTVNNLNGEISAQGIHSDGAQETMTWTFEEDGNTIKWRDQGNRWNASLRMIAPTVWQHNSGSHPYLLIYQH